MRQVKDTAFPVLGERPSVVPEGSLGRLSGHIHRNSRQDGGDGDDVLSLIHKVKIAIF